MEWNEGFDIGEVAGLAVARTAAEGPCPFCHGEGRRAVEVEEKTVSRDARGKEVVSTEKVRRVYRCRCQRVPDRVALYNAAELPARHAHCTMETFKAELARPTWSAVRKWLDTYQGGPEQLGLVLSGAPGRGKTHLLAAVVRELTFRYGASVRFIEFSHLIASIREGYDHDVGEARLLGPLVRVPVLAIDELGKGRGSDFESTILDEIVSRRYNGHAGPLLATTNFPLVARPKKENDSLSTGAMPSLAERLGERVWSRLKESCLFVEATGEDYRVVHSHEKRGHKR